MKFNVGYQQSPEFLSAILENRDRVHEVYFAWGDFPNGRGRMNSATDTLYPWEVQAQQIAGLKRLHENGIGLDLLLNGTCYGKESQSRALFEKIGQTVDYLCEQFSLSSVTTASPLIAKFLKNNFPDVTVRASVNMEIGSVNGMRYLADWFDSFYMKREYNRDFGKIRELTGWCRENGKELHLLANSGCLNFCSAHQFHDNLVSHEAEIAGMDNAYEFTGVCREYLKKEENLARYLSDTNFIRPEDLGLYEEWFSVAKLATRVNPVPTRVLRAYLEGHYTGAVTDLLEPNHSGVIAPKYIENSAIPKGFTEHVLHCDKHCETCTYCRDALKAALVDLGGAFFVGESSDGLQQQEKEKTNADQ